jgi:hypothetical protein
MLLDGAARVVSVSDSLPTIERRSELVEGRTGEMQSPSLPKFGVDVMTLNSKE